MNSDYELIKCKYCVFTENYKEVVEKCVAFLQGEDIWSSFGQSGKTTGQEKGMIK